MIPILFHIGSLPIRSYGVMMAIAFLVGIWLTRRRAKARGLDPDLIVDLAFFVIIASIAGARAMFVIVQWEAYRADPIAILRLWDGGLAQYGGIAAGVVAGLIFFRRRGIDPWFGADLTTPALAAGVAIGRLGCFLNGCCFGQPCDLPWAIAFHPTSNAGLVFGALRLHPTQIYESLAALGVLLILLFVERRKPFDGFLLWLFVILLSVYRFAVDPLRYYHPTSMALSGGAFALTSNQVVGLILIGVSIGFMLWLRRRAAAGNRRVSPPGDHRRP